MSQFFETVLKARFGDEDHAQIVYFPRIFHYFQCCLEDFFEHEGFPLRNMVSHMRLGIPLVSAAGEFHAPIRAGDRVHMRLTVPHLGTKSFSLAFEGFLNDNTTLAVKGQITCCAVDLDSLSSVVIPEPLRNCLARYSA